jgi:U4/U6.U5 tri-snRNP-associated protein 1
MDDEQQQQQQRYRASDLRGLKVGHDITDFEEGQETILTLKDRGILDDDEDNGDFDELTNVNMEDRERLLKNLDNKKKKPGYNPYDDDEFLLGQDEKPSLLPHYDEDKKREGFVLGKQGSISTASVAATRQKHQANQPQLSVAEKLKQVQTLDYDKTQGIKDYYTQDEINLTFKKPKKLKKKKKIRQRTTMAEDGDVPDSTAAVGDNQQEAEDEPRVPYQPALDANFVDDDDLQEALARSRRDANRQKKKLLKRMTPEDIARSIVEERTAQEGQQDAADNDNNETDETNGGGLVLSETTEFLNSVGNVPIYVREQRQNMATGSVSPTPDDREDADMDDTSRPTKNTTVTDIDEDQSTTPPPPEHTTANAPVEEDVPVYDEPLVGRGLAATLNLLTQKGKNFLLFFSLSLSLFNPF